MTALREAVDAALDAGGGDPRQVADNVASTLTGRRLREALAETLPAYVTAVMIERRRATVRALRVDDDNQPRSVRWEAAASIFTELFHNGTEWKSLGECTADDLEAGVVSRRSRAASILVEADRWERLAKAVRDAGVDTVHDLGIAVVTEALS